MKPLLLTLSLAITFLPFSYSQSLDTTVDDLKTFLPEGKHLAKLFAPALPDLTPHEKELQAKAMKAIMQNAAWFRDSAMTADPGKMLEKLGLTSEEQEEYIKISDRGSTGIRITGTDSLEIIRKSNVIFFRGEGRLKPLDSLQIDMVANRAIFRGQIIPFKRTSAKKRSEESNSDNPFGSAIKVYEYAYEPLPDATSDLTHMMDNMARYQLYVGRLEATGETIVTLMALKNENKRMVLNINVPFLFK